MGGEPTWLMFSTEFNLYWERPTYKLVSKLGFFNQVHPSKVINVSALKPSTSCNPSCLNGLTGLHGGITIKKI